MNRFTIVFLLSLIFIAAFAKAQTITQARFRISNKTKGFTSIDLVINNTIYVGIEDDGSIAYIESENDDINTPFDLERLGLPITFYGTSDIHDIPGKIKSIGNIKFTYYNVFDIHDERGNLKSIGDIEIKYCNTFDIHDPKGKVKSVGPVTIKYYNVFDQSFPFGYVKSIEGNTARIKVSVRNPIIERGRKS